MALVILPDGSANPAPQLPDRLNPKPLTAVDAFRKERSALDEGEGLQLAPIYFFLRISRHITPIMENQLETRIEMTWNLVVDTGLREHLFIPGAF